MMLRFHVQTAGSTLTAQQPDVNVVRVALQALAAVLGGAQSLHTNAKDEALGLPTEEAARLALRTQQIIAHETGVTSTADPFGGSYYIEKLTDEIERGAEEYIERIDAMGGTLAAIENGFIQNEIQNAAYAYQQAVERGDAIVVGVKNSSRTRRTRPPRSVWIPSSKSSRSRGFATCAPRATPARWTPALCALENAARSSDNLMPHILACAEAYATVGEISDRLRVVFGEYRERFRVPSRRHLPGASQQVPHRIRMHPRQVDQDVWVIKVVIGNEVRLGILRHQLLAILDAHPHHQCPDIVPQPGDHRATHLKRRRPVRVASSTSSSASAILRIASNVIAEQLYLGSNPNPRPNPQPHPLLDLAHGAKDLLAHLHHPGSDRRFLSSALVGARRHHPHRRPELVDRLPLSI